MALLFIASLLILPVSIAAIAWLMFAPLRSESELSGHEQIENLIASHLIRFSQLRPMLDGEDNSYIRRKLPQEEERCCKDDRRRVFRNFLIGLGSDFSRLNRFARLVDAYSPRRSKLRGLDDVWVAARFRLGYRFASLHLPSSRQREVRRLEELATLVGRISARVEAAMALADSGGETPEAQPQTME
jgi:hypothetical protein